MRVYEWLGLTVTIHGSAITFAKLPTLKRVSCNIAKCSTPLRIGNAGLGGRTSALAVHIETFPTHIAGLPVAVNICCHAYRHSTVTL